MVCIILTGLARSGKDTVGDYIAQKHGFNKYVLSDVIAQELRRNGIKATKEKMSILGDEIRREEGMDAIARRLAERIQKNEDCVIVGARSMQEVDLLKRKLGSAVLVRVDASAEKRFSRRGIQDSDEKEKFFERDELDKKNKGLEKVLKYADKTIDNNGSLVEMRDRINELMAEIIEI
jgi:dephospho-CoA kinase